MSNTHIDPQSNILWVDSNPNIYQTAGLLRAENWCVACFNETADALNAFQEDRLKPRNIHCVITSMMERGGRRERGLLNGLEMLDKIKIIWKNAGIAFSPLFAVISSTADVQKCKEHGVDIVVFGDYNALQRQVIDQLTKRLSNTHRTSIILIGIAGPSGCGKTTYAKHLTNSLHSPFLPVSLDHFFTQPINIDHPILGRMKSLEEPVTIKINDFLTALRQMKTDWESAPLYRSNVAIDKNKTIYIVVEGFLLFALSDDVTSMFDIRIFLDSTQDRCRMQRFRRQNRIDPQMPDSQVTITDRFSQWYDHLVWAEYLKRRDLQMEKAEKIFKPEEYDNRDYTKVDDHINERLKQMANTAAVDDKSDHQKHHSKL